ncbi:nitric oxide reductase subunit C [Nitrosomonas stercoris]|uniref:Nitric oxide reductase subunit C n=1 Tax=Nitrosomonas stercoris TaxID=1444684 RepID=A0A4Y1YMV0_9PROT|nr:nitric oxide reductase subunit C [Nitrosomonas stercoris]
MSEKLTKSAARNIFYGGTAFFLLLFIALSINTHLYIVNHSTDEATLTPSVAQGKRVWERHACINCHSLLGEGAYFAPEIGNVWVRYGGREHPEGARMGLKAWMRAQPTGVPGRRQMPQFNLTEQELDDLIDFLEWVSRIDTQGWPPNNAG